MSTTYHYLSFFDSIKQNGDRHKANGDKYLSEGKLKHAAGSYRKAAKNYERAIIFDAIEFTDSTIIDLMIDKTVNNINDAILYGTSYSIDGIGLAAKDIFK